MLTHASLQRDVAQRIERIQAMMASPRLVTMPAEETARSSRLGSR